MSETETARERAPLRFLKSLLENTSVGWIRRLQALATGSKEMQFTLSHVFIRELIERAEAFSDHEKVLQALTNLSKHQLEVFVREELGMPLHPGYFMELDQEAWQNGEVALLDSFYLNHDSMLARCQRAVLAATPSQRDRYVHEQHQVEVLQSDIVAQLSTSELMTIKDPTVRSQVEGRYPEMENRSIYALGSKLLYTLPKSPIHKGDKAYVNTLQAFYLPSVDEDNESTIDLERRLSDGSYRGRVITVSEGLFSDLSERELGDIHRHYGQQPLSLSEVALMSMITKLPKEFEDSRGREVFLDLTKKLFSRSHKRDIGQLLGSQQSREQSFAAVQPMIDEGSRFLAHILLTELGRATVNDAQFHDFPTRLYYAFGLVASPLIQKLNDPQSTQFFFSYEQAKRNYFQAHPLSVRSIDSKNEWRIDPALRQAVTRPEFLRDVKTIRLTSSQKENYQRSLQSLPTFYLKNIMSNSLCNAFSFGNFATNPNLLNLDLTKNILNGAPTLSLADVKTILGSDEGWKLGHCANTSCPNKGLEQMVGGCSICLTCQLRADNADYQKYLSALDQPESVGDAVRRLGSKAYDKMDDLRHSAQEIQRLNPSMFMHFMISSSSQACVEGVR